jgi:hypothetical protein
MCTVRGNYPAGAGSCSACLQPCSTQKHCCDPSRPVAQAALRIPPASLHAGCTSDTLNITTNPLGRPANTVPAWHIQLACFCSTDRSKSTLAPVKFSTLRGPLYIVNVGCTAPTQQASMQQLGLGRSRDGVAARLLRMACVNDWTTGSLTV